MDEEQIREMVRRIVHRTLGVPGTSRPTNARQLVTELDVQAVPVGGQFPVEPDALVTPLARQVAAERRVTLETSGPDPRTMRAGGSPIVASSADRQVIAIGADHGGFELKEMLRAFLEELGYAVVDCGTNSVAAVDYPDLALAVARMVAQGSAWRGVMVDGAGIGSCMAANKVPGVRAAMCYDQATAVNSREHNHANLLTLGAGLIGPTLARQIVKIWLETPSGSGRHARRVDKIMEIERRYAHAEK